MAKDILKDLGIEFSGSVSPGGVKLMFWGDTATRKTETVVRNFPNVLLIDTEGNSDVLLGHQKSRRSCASRPRTCARSWTFWKPPRKAS